MEHSSNVVHLIDNILQQVSQPDNLLETSFSLIELIFQKWCSILKMKPSSFCYMNIKKTKLINKIILYTVSVKTNLEMLYLPSY